jgi:hypothetical protein
MGSGVKNPVLVVMTPRRIDKRDLRAAFESILNANGLTAKRTGEETEIVPLHQGPSR